LARASAAPLILSRCQVNLSVKLATQLEAGRRVEKERRTR
jgi:hypothetical protein